MNGTVTYADTTYQSEAVFDCDEGFTLSSTAPRVCQADSTWSNSDPTCIINGKIWALSFGFSTTLCTIEPALLLSLAIKLNVCLQQNGLLCR